METGKPTNLLMLAAMVLLFSTMLDARLTIVLSVILLISLPIYKLVEMRRNQQKSKRDS